LLNAGALVPVTRSILLEIITKNVATPRLTNRGTEDDPNWTCVYAPLVPDEKTLRTLLTAETRKEGSLLARAMKV